MPLSDKQIESAISILESIQKCLDKVQAVNNTIQHLAWADGNLEAIIKFLKSEMSDKNS